MPLRSARHPLTTHTHTRTQLAWLTVLCVCITFVSRAADGPQVVSVSPANGANVTATSTDISFSATIPSGTGINTDSVVLIVDQEKLDVTYSNNAWHATVDNLAEGPHVATVTLIDGAGNPGGLKWTFWHDTGNPTISITVPYDMQKVLYTDFNIIGTFDGFADEDHASVKVLLNGIEYQPELNWTSATGGIFELDLLDLERKWYYVEARATTPSGIQATDAKHPRHPHAPARSTL